MKRLILIIYVTLVVVLAVATFVEQARGTAFIGAHVYHTHWFVLLWGVLAVCTVVVCWRMRLWRRVPVLLLHGSFLVILGGALLTFVWGEQGYVHLEEGKTTDRFVWCRTAVICCRCLSLCGWTASVLSAIPGRRPRRITSVTFMCRAMAGNPKRLLSP